MNLRKEEMNMAHLDINLFSKILNRSIDISLILPTDNYSLTPNANFSSTHYRDSKEDKLPLLILLHGYLGDCHSWHRSSSLERYAEEKHIAVVTFSGENQFYVNNQFNRWYDFIEEELKDFLYGTFPISEQRKHNYIAGLSMGGFGALYHGLSNPKAYSYIGAFSPATKVPNLSKSGLEVENEPLKSLIRKNKNHLPKIYLAIGSNDFLLDQNVSFIKYLEENNVENTHEIVPGYTHEWSFWDMELKKFLDLIEK